MNISMAILDSNREYLERLMEVLQENNELSVSVFTSAEKLDSAIQAKRYDIVLFDPDASSRKLMFYNTKLAVCLYSDEAQNTPMYAEVEKVHKYQRISKIYKDVIKLYADKAGYVAEFDKIDRTRMVAVYSPVGGSGKTTVALALASKLIAYGKNVLFLSLEQLSSASCVNPVKEDGITSLIETVSTEGSNFELKLKGIIKKGMNGMSYVEGFERIVDYNTITKTEIFDVIDKIGKNNSCDMVVVDMNSQVDIIAQVVFELADNIVIVERGGELPIHKINMFAQQALACEYINKMSKITNFVEGNVQVSNQMNVPCIGSVYNYGNQPLDSIIQAIYASDSIDVSAIMR